MANTPTEETDEKKPSVSATDKVQDKQNDTQRDSLASTQREKRNSDATKTSIRSQSKSQAVNGESGEARKPSVKPKDEEKDDQTNEGRKSSIRSQGKPESVKSDLSGTSKSSITSKHEDLENGKKEKSITSKDKPEDMKNGSDDFRKSLMKPKENQAAEPVKEGKLSITSKGQPDDTKRYSRKSSIKSEGGTGDAEKTKEDRRSSVRSKGKPEDKKGDKNGERKSSIKPKTKDEDAGRPADNRKSSIRSTTSARKSSVATKRKSRTEGKAGVRTSSITRTSEETKAGSRDVQRTAGEADSQEGEKTFVFKGRLKRPTTDEEDVRKVERGKPEPEEPAIGLKEYMELQPPPEEDERWRASQGSRSQTGGVQRSVDAADGASYGKHDASEDSEEEREEEGKGSRKGKKRKKGKKGEKKGEPDARESVGSARRSTTLRSARFGDDEEAEMEDGGERSRRAAAEAVQAAVERMAHLPLRVADLAADLRDLRKATVRCADMSADMQQDAVDCSAHALALYPGEHAHSAAYVKKEFDKKYAPTWHCVVGSRFGSFVTHLNRHFIFFFIGNTAVLLYRNN